ncbi:hypothetical protein NPIL_278011, partial [Nephila pilipes]
SISGSREKEMPQYFVFSTDPLKNDLRVPVSYSEISEIEKGRQS